MVTIRVRAFPNTSMATRLMGRILLFSILWSSFLPTTSARAEIGADNLNRSAPAEPHSNRFKYDHKGQYEPMLDFGIGLFSASLPHYPGSTRNRLYLLPSPIGNVRTDYIRSTQDEGIQSLMYTDEYIGVRFSVAGSFPSDSKDNPERDGMPDLPLLFEVGPKVILFIVTSRLSNFNLHLPVRGVFSRGPPYIWGPVGKHGISFSPYFSFQRKALFQNRDEHSVILKGTWTDRPLQGLFYDVEQKYVNSARSFYRAKSGYLGTSLLFSHSIEFSDKTTAYFYYGWNFFHGVANKNSPLHKKDVNVLLGVGIGTILYESEQLIWVEDKG